MAAEKINDYLSGLKESAKERFWNDEPHQFDHLDYMLISTNEIKQSDKFLKKYPESLKVAVPRTRLRSLASTAAGWGLFVGAIGLELLTDTPLHYLPENNIGWGLRIAYFTGLGLTAGSLMRIGSRLDEEHYFSKLALYRAENPQKFEIPQGMQVITIEEIREV